MDPEHNKRLASELFARFTAGDVDGALALLTDDATWWIAGKPGQLPAAGTHGRDAMARLVGAMMAGLEGGLRMTVKSAIAEGDQVAVRVEGYGELRNGRVYDQEYHFLITIRDGKIGAVREYLDTQHVFATWFAP